MEIPRNIAAAGMARPGSIRVMLVDDSSFVRRVMASIIEREDGMEVAAEADCAEDALAQLRTLHVNVILLDLEMPGMGGMAALPEIARLCPQAKVIVVSSLTADGAEHSVTAMAQGAADTLLKPEPGGFTPTYKEELAGRIRALGKRKLRRDADKPAAPVIVTRPASPQGARIVAIGASTGGIGAIGSMLAALPERIGVPILITQHLPESFIEAFTRQIAQISGREAVIAQAGMRLEAERIHVAPGDAHMILEGSISNARIALDRSVADSGCLPAVDPMLSSVAAIFGPRALAIVLTGMGRDGTLGAGDIVDRGGTVLVQNEASSAVWGMPGSIARQGLASGVLHPADLAARIVTCTARDR